MVLTMNPYRENEDKLEQQEKPPERTDDLILLWGWFFVGCLLVASDVNESEPWGVAFSLGMIVVFVATRALWRHHMNRRGFASKWFRRAA